MIYIKNPLLRRTLKIAIPFIAIPLIVFMGAVVFDERRYIFISLTVALISLILFACGFEKKAIGSRRMVIVAIMTALSVVGRFIPFFKPISAITIITAIYLGSESGFLVGALSTLISNIYFGQGPWTPFQMLSWGLIGLFAGFLANPLKRRKCLLLIYGIVSGVIYSAAMDIWTVISYNGSFNPKLYTAALLTAVPHMIMYCVSNFIFLYFLAEPFGEKLERIKIKYGI